LAALHFLGALLAAAPPLGGRAAFAPLLSRDSPLLPWLRPDAPPAHCAAAAAILALAAANPVCRAALHPNETGDAPGSDAGIRPTQPLLLARAVRLLDGDTAQLAARRAVLAALNSCAHSPLWPAWPDAAASARIATRLAGGALLDLRPRAGGTIQNGPTTSLARDCLLLLGCLLSEPRTRDAAAFELGGDPAAAQRCLAAAAAAAAADGVGDATLARLGARIGRTVAQQVALAEGEEGEGE